MLYVQFNTKQTTHVAYARIWFMEKKPIEGEIVARIDEILTRGVGSFIDPDGVFRKKLLGKAMGTYTKEIVIKFGVDPNRPDIHLGHAVVLRKLRQFQDLGCKVIFLVGDFTAMIGDPTGKSKVRPEIELSTMVANIQSYIKQIPKILKIEPTSAKGQANVTRDPDGFIVDSPSFAWMRNAEWFQGVTDLSTEGATPESRTYTSAVGEKTEFPENSFLAKAWLFQNTRIQNNYLKKPQTRGVTFVNIMSVLRKVSFAQLIERDMFQDRINNNEPLFMHEMLYPVIQGIDSDVIADIYGSCDLEVGGTDQTFNMLMGRKVMEMTNKEPQAVLAFELLVGLDGKEKMSKSLDNYVAITDEPNDMFGKLMSVPDEALAKYFELCTYTPLADVAVLEKKLKTGKVHPKEVKMDLAEQIVEIYHGGGKGKSAREHFVNTFQKKEIPDDVEVVLVAKGTLLVDALLGKNLVASKTEFRRLLDDGAIRKNGEEKLSDPLATISEKLILRIGKHRFVAFDIK